MTLESEYLHGRWGARRSTFIRAGFGITFDQLMARLDALGGQQWLNM